MKKLILTVALFSAIGIAPINLANAEQLKGTPKLACEAILCLSSSDRPSKCNPALTEYFSISARKMSDTIRKRKNFLNQCPAAQVSADVNFKTLIDVQAQYNNNCNAEALNRLVDSAASDDDPDMIMMRTKTQLPEYCKAYRDHVYTRVKMPKYQCDGKFYKAEDWQSGYEHISINYREYRQLKAQGERVSLKIIDAPRGEADYYRLIPIKKNCWVD